MMFTNVNIESAPRLALRGEVHTFVNGCLHRYRSVARVGGQLVTAFGVVGFLRVKDEQKSVHIAEALASAGIYSARSHIKGKTDAGRRHVEGRTKAKLIQNECRHDANLMQQRCKLSMP